MTRCSTCAGSGECVACFDARSHSSNVECDECLSTGCCPSCEGEGRVDDDESDFLDAEARRR